MAARLHPAPSTTEDLVDLRRLSARELEPLLSEEVRVWREELEWDFEKSAELVRRFVELRALNGCALIGGGAVLGYVYFILEEAKGLVGDLYVRRGHPGTEYERRLLEAVLDPILAAPQVTRVECQLMMMRPAMEIQLPRREYLSTFPRNFMRIDLRRAELREGRVRRPVYIEKWSDHYQEGAAQLIAAAYTGHIDGRINDQYRNVSGARRFLYNIVQYPGCGTFYRPGSYAAFEADSGRLCGISLASLVAPDTGHITQICVSPTAKGTGIGHELLRQSLTTLREARCRSVSLTVTAANREAVTLYERVGFETVRQFSAFVWEGFRR
jgi:ribosomal protein S18 acetylase RimI-like enzyme